MEKLHEYLQALISTSSYELHLEPNRNPYIVSASGQTDVDETPLQGTQISMMVFPLIPPDVKQDLPNKPQIEFIHPHNLGKFSFVVQKSPNGFNVTIKPVFFDSSTISPGLHEDAGQTEYEFEGNASAEETETVETPAEDVPALAVDNSIPGFESNAGYTSGQTPLQDLLPAEEYKLNEEPADESPFEFTTSNNSEFVPAFAPATGSPLTDTETFEFASGAESQAHVQLPSADRRAGERRRGNLMLTAKMDAMLDRMIETGASELYISADAPPMARKGGELQHLTLDEGVITPEIAEEILNSIMPPRVRKRFDETGDAGFLYELDGTRRFRCDAFTDKNGIGGVFRRLPEKISTAEDLRLSKETADLCALTSGIVLIAGMTDSGKSTMLAAMLDSVNKTRAARIVTIEDKIEFVHKNQRSVVNQREVHNHTSSAAEAFRSAMLQGADVIVVDEIRDPETISLMLEASEKGCLVLASMHSSSATAAVECAAGLFSDYHRQYMLDRFAQNLKAVVLADYSPGVPGLPAEALIIDSAASDLIREGEFFRLAKTPQLT